MSSFVILRLCYFLLLSFLSGVFFSLFFQWAEFFCYLLCGYQQLVVNSSLFFRWVVTAKIHDFLSTLSRRSNDDSKNRKWAFTPLQTFRNETSQPFPSWSRTMRENLNFYFHTSLWCFKTFYKVLKALIKLSVTPQRSGKFTLIFIFIRFSEMHGAGRANKTIKRTALGEVWRGACNW